VSDWVPSQPDCWEQWVNDYGDPLFRFAYTYVHDRESAQDIVQEALFRAWKEQQNIPHVPFMQGGYIPSRVMPRSIPCVSESGNDYRTSRTKTWGRHLCRTCLHGLMWNER